MFKAGRIILISLVILSQMKIVLGEPIKVGLSVQNVPPSLSSLKVFLKDGTINISFLVEESNTLADLKEIEVSIYEQSEHGISVQRFTWKGLEAQWIPEPLAFLSPSSSLQASKSFLFMLATQVKEKAEVSVTVAITDSRQNQVSGTASP